MRIFGGGSFSKLSVPMTAVRATGLLVPADKKLLVSNFTFLRFTPKCIMVYRDMPLMIPLIATGYLLAIYVLLILAQRSGAWRRPEG
ncbi:hypothetical protein LAY41_16370 [Argonema galeatum A003/A1]|nr:hypothetical protein [Argonema galeatum A003/A1]